MKGLESSETYAEKVLVMFNHEGRPDFEIRMEGSSLEQNRQMGEWFDNHSREAKEIIRRIGGVVLQENWFWPGLTTKLPVEDEELHMQTVAGAPNVSGVFYL